MHGQSVKFYCDRGYHRIGASSIICNDGKWDKQSPLCKGESYLIDLPVYSYLLIHLVLVNGMR